MESGRRVRLPFAPIVLHDSSRLEVKLFVEWLAGESVLRKWAAYRLENAKGPKLVSEIVLENLDTKVAGLRLLAQQGPVHRCASIGSGRGIHALAVLDGCANRYGRRSGGKFVGIPMDAIDADVANHPYSAANAAVSAEFAGRLATGTLIRCLTGDSCWLRSHAASENNNGNSRHKHIARSNSHATEWMDSGGNCHWLRVPGRRGSSLLHGLQHGIVRVFALPELLERRGLLLAAGLCGRHEWLRLLLWESPPLLRQRLGWLL